MGMFNSVKDFSTPCPNCGASIDYWQTYDPAPGESEPTCEDVSYLTVSQWGMSCACGKWVECYRRDFMWVSVEVSDAPYDPPTLRTTVPVISVPTLEYEPDPPWPDDEGKGVVTWCIVAVTFALLVLYGWLT